MQAGLLRGNPQSTLPINPRSRNYQPNKFRYNKVSINPSTTRFRPIVPNEKRKVSKVMCNLYLMYVDGMVFIK